MKPMLTPRILVPALLLFAVPGGAQPVYVFEDLGRPLTPNPLPIEVVTGGPETGFTAWGTMHYAEGKGLVGVDTATGEMTWVDMGEWEYGRINITRAANGDLYLYTGDPGRFLRYRVGEDELVDLGAPDVPASYTMGGAVGPDGRFYVGSYPGTRVVYVDPATDETGSLGPMSDDLRCKYVLQTVVSDANVVYVAVGLHHAELWAVPAATGEKRQILPEEISGATDRVRIMLGDDGNVYGSGAGRAFRCLPEGIEFIEDLPPERDPTALRRMGDQVAMLLTSGGELALVPADGGAGRTVDILDTRAERQVLASPGVVLVQTEFEGVPVRLYGAFCQWNGKIYGGGFMPANLFSYDPATGQMQDLGRRTGGRIQVYDILGHPRGLFISSYVGSHLDFFNPETNERVHIGQLERDYDQERGLQLIIGPDEMIYLASRPTKGKLGGALTVINPEDFSFTCHRHVLEDQSVISVVSVPATNEVFATTSNFGGSGSVATQPEGYVFLWDCAEQKLSWVGTPLPGLRSYGKAVMADTGLIYVHAHDRYFAFDPVRREVVFVGDMPVERVHHQGIAHEPSGPDGLIFGIGDDALFALDPRDHSARVIARHEAIRNGRGLMATRDGVVYFINGSRLWRVDTTSGAGMPPVDE